MDIRRAACVVLLVTLSLVASIADAALPKGKKPQVVDTATTFETPDGMLLRFVPRPASAAAATGGEHATASVPTELDMYPCLTRTYQDWNSFNQCNISDAILASTDFGLGWVVNLDGTTPEYNLQWISSAQNLTSVYTLNDPSCPPGYYYDPGPPLAGAARCWSPGTLYLAWLYPAHPPGNYTFNRWTTYGLLPSLSAVVKPGKLQVESGSGQTTLTGYRAQAPLVIGLRDFRGNRVMFPIAPGSTDKRSKMRFTITGPRNSTGQSVDPASQEPNIFGETSVGLITGSQIGTYSIAVASDDADPLSPDATLTALARKEPDDQKDKEEGDGKDPCAVADPISLGIGNSFQQETDYARTGLSPLEFVRYYNTFGSKGLLTRNYWSTTFDRAVLLPAAGQPTRVRRPDGLVVPFVLQAGNYVSLRPYFHGTLRAFGSGWQYVTEDNVTETYDAQGRWTSIADAVGRTMTSTWNTKGLLSKVTSNTGETLTFTYNTYNQLATMTDHAGRVWTYTYNNFANLIETRDPDGLQHTYHYDAPAGPYLLAGMSLSRGGPPIPASRFVFWKFDAQGRATSNYFRSFSQAETKHFDIVYDDATGERTVTDGVGNATHYQTQVLNGRGFIDGAVGPGFALCGLADSEIARDLSMNVTSRTEFGRRTEYANFDAKGQYGTMTEAAGTPAARQTQYTYDARFVGKPATIVEASVAPGRNRTTQRTYNAAGDVVQETINGFRPDGTAVARTIATQYAGPYGQVSQVDGPRTDVNDITRFEYHATTKRLLRVIAPDGTIARNTMAYTTTGQLAAEDRPNGLHLAYAYYPGSDLLKSITESGTGATRTTTWTYDDYRHVVSIQHSDGTNPILLTEFQYNPAGDLTRVSAAGAGSIDFSYDRAGNRIRDSYRDGGSAERRWVQRAFDAYGRIKDVIEPYSAAHSEFHPDGTLTNRVDGENHETEFVYDQFKRMTQVLQPGQAATTFGYDVAGRTTRVTDAGLATTTQSYDDLGNRLSLDSPDAGRTTFEYDNAGNAVRSTNALGEISTFTFDALDRLVGVDRIGTEDDESYVYGGCVNGVARLCSANNGIGDYVRFEYDVLGRIAKQTTNSGVLGMKYDAGDNVSELTYPSLRKVLFLRDAAGQVTSVSVIDGGNSYVLARSIQYLPFGPAKSWVYGNGLVETRQFDLEYRPLSMTAGTRSAISYGNYDANDQPRQRTFNGDVQTFSYDALGRIDVASGAFGTQDYDHDAVGNRSQLTVGGQSVTYAYTAGSNRLSSDAAWTYRRDANGNEIERRAPDGHGSSFVYSAKNRLVAVTDLQNPSNVRGAYRYNALGQRTVKSTPFGDVRFIYGLRGELLAEALPNGSITQEYVYLDGIPIALLGPPAAPAPPSGVDQIIDNPASSEFCSVKKASIAVGGSYLTCPSVYGGPSFAMTWPWTPPFSGDYDVSVFWAWSSECQRYAFGFAPNESICAGFGAAAGTWVSLGRWHLDANVARPRIDAVDNIGKTVRVDAIRYVLAFRDFTDRDYTYVHTDALGTPVRATDKNGNVVWSIVQDPFGLAAVNDDPDANGVHTTLNLRFPGQYFDAETGLHYNLNRDYDPALGRYLEADPIGLDGGLNGFAYASGNPVMRADPLGLEGVGVWTYPAGPMRDAYLAAQQGNTCRIFSIDPGKWIKGLLGTGTFFGATGGAYVGGSIAAGHATGILGGLGVAEGVYAGAMAGITIGASSVLVVGGIALLAYGSVPLCDDEKPCK